MHENVLLLNEYPLYFFGYFFSFRLLNETGSKLSSLILTGNTDVGTIEAGSLLTAVKDSRTLRTLNLSACGVKSPLGVTFFDSFRTLASQNLGCLNKLDLSHNLLTVTDREQLADKWNSSCSEDNFACLENTLCMFTK